MATLKEIVARSALMHPTLFAETLDNVAADHTRHASEYYYAPGAAAARGMANEARKAAAALREEEHGAATDFIASDCSRLVIAASAAARLQCLPRHVLLNAEPGVMFEEESSNADE